MRTLLVFAVTFLFASVVSAADTLDVYVVDTEGGKAVILLTPEGETMLVDAGYPTEDDRDTKRIVEVAQAAGIKRFDYVVATHYDADHAGNVPRVDAQIPGKVFVDHGDPVPTMDAKAKERLLRALREGDRRPEAHVGQAGRHDPDERGFGSRSSPRAAGRSPIRFPASDRRNRPPPTALRTGTATTTRARSACFTSSAGSACSTWRTCSRGSSTTSYAPGTSSAPWTCSW